MDWVFLMRAEALILVSKIGVDAGTDGYVHCVNLLDPPISQIEFPTFLRGSGTKCLLTQVLLTGIFLYAHHPHPRVLTGR